MRWVAIVPLFLAGCASLPPPPTQSLPAVPRHPPATFERPWLVPTATDEITLFDTRMLPALRKLDETSALNANGDDGGTATDGASKPACGSASESCCRRDPRCHRLGRIREQQSFRQHLR